MIKNIMTGIMNIYLIILWCFLLPFVYLFDRVFGEWEDNKKMWLSHRIFGQWKNNEKNKNNIR